MMFVGTHKDKKKKKKIEKTVGSKRSRVGTNRRWLKMTQTDKEKLRAISIEIGIVDDRLDSFETWSGNTLWSYGARHLFYLKLVS